MSDALRVTAERAPGVPVEGWTDRPTVAPDLRMVWQSYCELLKVPDLDVSSVSTWVERVHWREDAAGQSMLFQVFAALLADRAELLAAAPPPAPEPTSDG